MEIRTLQYFLTIAREESISGAAEYLHVTQPTLSRQMKELEEELGKQLFIRGKRRITLTDEGMILRKRAEEILGLVERAEAEVKANEELLTGDIYLGCGESEGMRPIAKTIATMLEKYPHVNQRKLNIVGTYNLLFNASLIVEEGNLYALCLDKIFNSNNSSLCFRPLEPKLEANMLIIWKKYQLFTKSAETFLNMIKDNIT